MPTCGENDWHVVYPAPGWAAQGGESGERLDKVDLFIRLSIYLSTSCSFYFSIFCVTILTVYSIITQNSHLSRVSFDEFY